MKALYPRRCRISSINSIHYHDDDGGDGGDGGLVDLGAAAEDTACQLEFSTVCGPFLEYPRSFFSFGVAVCLCHEVEAATVAWTVRAAAVAAHPQVHLPNPILRTVASLAWRLTH